MNDATEELIDVRCRIERLLIKLGEKSGGGYIQSYISDGMKTNLRVNGIKSPDEWQDELLNTFIWVYSIKDYLKNAFNKVGRKGKEIEDEIDNQFSLQLISDVSNMAKHGDLNKSRSAQYARLKQVTISVPGQAMSKLTFIANDILLDIHASKNVKVFAEIVDNHGRYICDAFELLKSGLDIWESKILLLEPTDSNKP